MMNRARNRTWLFFLASFLPVAAVAGAQPALAPHSIQTDLGPERDAYGTSKVPPMDEAIETEDGRIRIVVQLSDPPLATYRGELGLRATSPAATGERKLDLRSPAALAYRGYLVDRQQTFIRELARVAPTATVDHRYQVTFNGLAMAVDEDAVESIASLPGVARVYPDKLYYQSLDASLPLIGAQELWDDVGGQGNAGAGIKVAVVDGGIRPEHPMFDGSTFSFPAGYPLADDYCGTVDPGFCNGKLIVARHFNAGFGPLHPAEVDSPLGINGHGTHVAGIAAGNPVAGADTGDGVPEDISGVAPRAWLMAYKALWWNGTTGAGATSDLIAAVDAATADGADVINNSWGGGGGENPATDAFGPVFQAANAAGVLSVAAAGNSGPGPDSIGCPGCHEVVLTVGNTTHNRIHALTFDVTSPGGGPGGLGCLEGTGPAFTATLGPEEIVYAGDVGDPLGCSPFPAGSMSGAIALISRGTCSFFTKVTNAEAAGAVAAVVFNNLPGPPITMGGLNAGETISSCMLSNDDGGEVRDFVQANPGAEGQVNYPASRVTNDDWEDFVSATSSRGPNGDPDVLKPDVAAPGTRIFSAWSPDHPTGGSDFVMISGTSMASPHVAGAAALMLQKHPTWTPEQIKTALTSTAMREGVVKEDGVTPADPFDQGAGRLDLEAASRAGVTFDLPSMAEDGCFLTCTFTRTIRNELPFPVLWVAEVNKEEAELGVKVSPKQVLLGSGQSRTFQVEVDTTLVEQGQWHFAHVVWDPFLVPAADAVLPVAVFAVDSTDAALLTKSVDQPVASPNEVLSYDISLTNLTLTDPIDLVDVIPDNSTYVPGSASALVDGVPDPSFTFDAGNNRLTWSGSLDPATLQVVPGASPFGYFSLSSIGVTPLPCSSVCDDTSITLSGLPPFQYLGATYDTVVMSTNGFIVAGGDSNNAFTPFNQDLPDPAAPNNVIAPFWTDFDLDGTSPTDTGAGIWYAAVLSAGPQVFTVLEWEAVELFGVPGFPFTFQIWIEGGTDNIWFTYAAIPGLPSFLTVGVEDAAGLLGSSYYFDGSGTPPAVGADLQVDSAAGGVAQFSFQVEVGCLLDPVVNVAEITSGATTEMAFAVTEVEADGLALCVDGECPGVITLTGSGATPYRFVSFWRGEGAGSSAIPVGQCSGTLLDLDQTIPFLPPALANGKGEFGLHRWVPGSACGDLLQAVDLQTCATSNTAAIP